MMGSVQFLRLYFAIVVLFFTQAGHAGFPELGQCENRGYYQANKDIYGNVNGRRVRIIQKDQVFVSCDTNQAFGPQIKVFERRGPLGFNPWKTPITESWVEHQIPVPESQAQLIGSSNAIVTVREDGKIRFQGKEKTIDRYTFEIESSYSTIDFDDIEFLNIGGEQIPKAQLHYTIQSAIIPGEGQDTNDYTCVPSICQLEATPENVEKYRNAIVETDSGIQNSTDCSLDENKSSLLCLFKDWWQEGPEKSETDVTQAIPERPRGSSDPFKSETELDAYFFKFRKGCLNLNECSRRPETKYCIPRITGPPDIPPRSPHEAYLAEYKHYIRAVSDHQFPYALMSCILFKESNFVPNAKNLEGSGALGIAQFLEGAIDHIHCIVSSERELLKGRFRNNVREAIRFYARKRFPSPQERDTLACLQSNYALEELRQYWKDYFIRIAQTDVYKRNPAYKGIPIPPQRFSEYGATLPPNAIGAMGVYLRFIDKFYGSRIRKLPGFNMSDPVEVASAMTVGYHLGIGSLDYILKKSTSYRDFINILGDYGRLRNILPRSKVTNASIREFLAYRRNAINCMKKGSELAPVTVELAVHSTCAEQGAPTHRSKGAL